ncbi:MAG TPA: hypothetical protein EYG98_05650 [Sulfurovum sp.]|nr:hypothetical protein [Sulfurovum sp.]
MKVIIDLIEDIREEIGDDDSFTLHVMLLKENPEDEAKLLYAGEASLNSFIVDKEHKQLQLLIGGNKYELIIGDLVKHLLILSSREMMYEICINVNAQHSEVEVIGFGKSIEDKKYIFFIKI